jgi:hypothetical protein
MLSADTASDIVRRALVAGTETYPQSGGQLKPLTKVRRELALVCGALHEVCRMTATIQVDPSHTELLQAIGTAVAAPLAAPGTAETLVLYYTGHGVSPGAGNYYLCTHDTVPGTGHWETTAVSSGQLASVLGATTEYRQVIMVIDACYAEAALDVLAFKLTIQVLAEGAAPELGIMVAASRADEAQQLAFAQAFVDGLRQPHVGRTDPYVDPQALVEQINGRLGEERAGWLPLRSRGARWAVFPNPRFQGSALPVPRRLLRFFAGRHRARAAVADHLAGSDPGAAVLAVTGKPGSGKSTLLSRAYLDREDAAEVVLVDARQATRDDVVSAVFAGLRLDRPPTSEAQLERLRQIPHPVCLLLDDITGTADAADQEQLASTFILPLAADPGPVRMVVTCDALPPQLDELGAVAAIDLDSDDYFDREDVVDFVSMLLAAIPGSPFRSAGPGRLRRAGEQIADQVGRSFLEALYLARFFATGDDQVVPRDPAVAVMTRAFDAHLAALRQQVAAAHELLAPLAFAEGTGIANYTAWLQVSQRLMGGSYDADQLDRLVDLAGETIIAETSGYEGRASWRLLHGELAKALGEDVDPRAAHAAFAEVLLQQVPRDATGNLQWTGADEYTRQHLAVHAGRAGLLDCLVDDPGYLLWTDPARMDRALTVDASPHSLAVRNVIRAIARAGDTSTADKASRLTYLARAGRLSELARRADELPQTWRTLWVAGSAAGTVTALGHGDSIASDRILAGDEAGVLRVLRLRDGALLGELAPPAGGGSWATAVCCGTLNSRPIAVIGDFGGGIRWYDLGTGECTVGRHSGPTVTSCAAHNGEIFAGTESGWSVFDAGTGAEVTSCEVHDPPPDGFVVGLAGDEVVVLPAVEWPDATVLSVDTGADHVRGSAGRRGIAAVAPGRNGAGAVGGGYDGTVWVFQPGRTNRVLTAHGDRVSRVLPGTDGVWSAGYDGTVRRTPYSATGRAEVIWLGEPITDLVVSPAGWLVAATRDHGPAAIAWRTTLDSQGQVGAR